MPTPTNPGPGDIIVIDVSGAPRFVRSFEHRFERGLLAAFLAFLAVSALGLAGLAAEAALSIDVRDYRGPLSVLLILGIAGPFIAVFQSSRRRDLERARRMTMGPYGVSYAEIRRAVKNLFRPPARRNSRTWAMLNFAGALAIGVYLWVNEKRMVEARQGPCSAYGTERFERDIIEGRFENCNPYGNAIFMAGLAVVVILFLNGTRIFGLRSGFAKYAIALFSRSVAFILFALIALAAIAAWGLAVAVSGSLVWHLWTLFMGRPAILGLGGSRDELLWTFVAGVLATSLLGAAVKDAAAPIWRPRLAAVANTLRRWWRAASLPSARLEERRDRRNPILYLRSFHEDRRHVEASPGEYDRLAEVIAAPLRQLGPLLAVGKPGELASPGAARAYYSESQWQEAVASIMDRAGFVVAVVGWTGGLEWEIQAIKGRGHLGKSIWVLPPDAEHHAVLCDWLMANFRGTAYEQTVKAVDLRHAIAVHPEVDGRLVVITGSRRDAGEYEAAIQTAVFGMVRHLARRP